VTGLRGELQFLAKHADLELKLAEFSLKPREVGFTGLNIDFELVGTLICGTQLVAGQRQAFFTSGSTCCDR
jgi:hypothetical protein